MLKEREHVITRLSQIIQIGLTIASFLLTWKLFYHIGPNTTSESREYLFLLFLIIPGWGLLLENSGLCWLNRDDKYSYLLFGYLKLIGTGTLALYFVSKYLKTEYIPDFYFIVFFVINFLVLFSYKLFVFKIIKFFRRRGYNSRQILIIADKQSIEYIHELLDSKDWGYRIWGIISSSSKIEEEFGHSVHLVDEDSDIRKILDKSVIDEVVYCKGSLEYTEIDNLVELCAEVGIVFRLKPNLTKTRLRNLKFSYLNQTPVYIFRNIPENYLALKMKRLIDLAFSVSVLVILSPVLVLIGIIVKITDGGPVFFVQERVGLNGRRFKCLKYRTMVVNAEALKEGLVALNEQTGPVFKMKFDPRVTSVGRFLRQTSLDELPQFLNVLNGDMSVVGPRPPIPSEVEKYERWQIRRLSMKPGITCIWQVSGRNEIEFEDWVRLDLEYINNWSLKLDLIIILRTIKVMLKGNGQ